MVNYLKVLVALVRSSVLVLTEYRKVFFINLMYWCTWAAVQIVFLDIIFLNTSSINGWTKYELIFFLGMNEITFSLFNTFTFSSMASIERHVVRGTMDYILLKPINSRFLLTFNNCNINGIFVVLFGLILIVYSSIKMAFVPTFSQVIIAISMIIMGSIILNSLYSMVSAIAVVLIRTSNINGLFLTIATFMAYPTSIYSGIVKFALMTVVPMGILVDFPVRVLLKGLSYRSVLVSLLYCVIFFAVSQVVWNKCMLQYRSASS
ncbi:MAG: transporter family protein [Clostridia bacterium]|nr:transporter family protein [Clostridia bacterium]